MRPTALLMVLAATLLPLPLLGPGGAGAPLPGVGAFDPLPVEVPPQPPQPCISPEPLRAFVCLRFAVDCPGAGAALGGDLALGLPLAPPRGTLLFHGGGAGTNFWSGSNPAALAFVTELRERGFTVAQVRWDASWSMPPQGVPAGHLGTSCRGAAVAAWVHDALHAPLHPDLPGPVPQAGVGQCGFCVIGWSHGSVMMAYGLAFHGFEDFVDAAVLEAGPRRVDQARGCMVEDPPEERHGTDVSFGIRTFDGPCFRQDPSWVPRWEADSLLTGDADYRYPRTRVEFVFGTEDHGGGPQNGARLAQRLRDEGQELLRVQVVPGAPHNLMATPEGVAAMRRAVLGT